MIHIHIDTSELIEKADDFPRMKKPIERAQMRAINKTVKQTRTRVIREVAKASDVPQKLLRGGRGRHGRVFTGKAKRNRLRSDIWLGTGSIKAVYLGKPRQTRAGVTVRHRTFDGAFVATMPSGHTGIFRRKGAGRLPIDEMRVQLTGGPSAMRRASRYARERLPIVFDQQLNYELNVRGKR